MNFTPLITHHASRIALFLALLAAGCANQTQSYWGKRWLDFADCWDASTGVAGPVPYIRLRMTDWLVLGGGEGQTFYSIGWHGRYTAAGSEIEKGEGVPFSWGKEWAGAPPMIESKGIFVTGREYDTSVKPCWGTQVAERYTLGLWVVWLLNLRFGFNPVEFADLVVGFFGPDILKDDAVEPPDWPAKLRQPEKPKHPVL
ncbi:MAG: hypothetical protein FJ291_17155 [Planctomycetes bacterium]|nr:hypothetical protein [Planctomycetota bacterium]